MTKLEGGKYAGGSRPSFYFNISKGIIFFSFWNNPICCWCTWNACGRSHYCICTVTIVVAIFRGGCVHCPPRSTSCRGDASSRWRGATVGSDHHTNWRCRQGRRHSLTSARKRVGRRSRWRRQWVLNWTLTTVVVVFGTHWRHDVVVLVLQQTWGGPEHKTKHGINNNQISSKRGSVPISRILTNKFQHRGEDKGILVTKIEQVRLIFKRPWYYKNTD